MADLVVTVPKELWLAWIAEGDAAGDLESGKEWRFYVGWRRPLIEAGERLYIVAWNRLRGYAPVTQVVRIGRNYAICRRGRAVAVTIEATIKGFRGVRRRWWSKAEERSFSEWCREGVGNG